MDTTHYKQQLWPRYYSVVEYEGFVVPSNVSPPATVRHDSLPLFCPLVYSGARGACEVGRRRILSLNTMIKRGDTGRAGVVLLDTGMVGGTIWSYYKTQQAPGLYLFST